MSEKKSKKIKQTKVLVIILTLIVVAIGVCVCVMLNKNNLLPFVNKSGNSKVEETDKNPDEEMSVDLETEVQIEQSEEYIEPAAGTLNISQIQGFTYADGAISAENSEGAEDGKNSEERATAVVLSDENLTAEAIGKYSGSYIEDGSDEPTANVAAMLITNNSDKMLQIAEITFQVNETETASFKVTNLPSGTSTLVMEANKREFKEEDTYTYGEVATAYIDQPTLEEDKFEISTEKGIITLKNKTDQSYDMVYVYYKYVQLGGAYIGGITYRTPFENVPAGGKAESIAAHFNPDSSQIMAVQIQEQ